MILWTIQHRDAYKKMMGTGTLQADGQHSPCLDNFRELYRWMAEQMIKRIGDPPEGIVYPVWAWYQWEGKRKRPDMRTHGRGCGEKGTPITLLTIDVPEKHIRNLRQNKGIRTNILIPNLIPIDFMNGWNPQKSGIP